jgi:putative hydrolase of the HAD superfamily
VRRAGALQAILLDAAGTLFSPSEPVGATYARLARDYGVQLPAARVDEAFARVFRTAAPMVFPGESPARIRECERLWWHATVRSTFLAADGTVHFRDFDGYFDTLFEHFAQPSAWSLRPGAGAALGALHERGFKLGVVSNFDHRLAGILDGLGLAAHLDVVITPAVAGAAKPDARIFELALAQLRVAAARAAYIGDDADLDVRAARSAGLRAIDVTQLRSLADLPHRIDALIRNAGRPS